MKNQEFNPKVDAYIAKAQPFAQPILSHIRGLVHKACPEVEEAIKWSMPFFVLRGVILGHMAAFKQHCAIGLWGPEMNAILNEAGLHSENGMLHLIVSSTSGQALWTSSRMCDRMGCAKGWDFAM